MWAPRGMEACVPLNEEVVAKLDMFLVRRSPSAALCTKSGTVKKSSKVSIFFEMPWLAANTCFLIYLMKASELHLPTSIIVYTGVPERNILIAPAERLMWVPTSSGLKPSLLSEI